MNSQALLGFIFALIAAAMWGALPIAIKQVMQVLDAQTLVWLRFSVAAIGLLMILAYRKKLPNITALLQRGWLFFVIAIIGLAANFFLYNVSLQYIPPTTSQVISPLSSFAMLFAGIWIFKETIGKHQKIGLLILSAGLLLFFNDRWNEFLQLTDYSIGVFWALLASFIWILYGISQKILLRWFSSPHILLLIYIGCSLVFAPFPNLNTVVQLNSFQWGCLIFCCLNTLIAYTAYAESLARWEVAKVSAVMTQIPVFTLLFSMLLHYIDSKHFADYQLNLLSYFGAGLVVFGALISAIGHRLSIWHK